MIVGMKILDNLQVGDAVTIDNVKRKWRIPKNAKFEIVKIDKTDPTVMIGVFEKLKYFIYLEHVMTVFTKREKVNFT